MSTQGLGQCLERDARDGQRRTLELDLNYPPLDGNMVAANSQEYSAELHSDTRQEIGDCVEVIDDDLAIVSQRIFVEAKNNSQRNHSQAVNELRDMLTNAGGLLDSFQDVAELAIWYVAERRNRPDEATPDADCQINVKACNSNKNVAASPQLPKNPVAAAPTFSCPICMGPLSEATTTKCGHIFCKDCIKAAIAAQGKCPNCRRKLGKQGIIRVYLPTLS